jgi:uncharacterized membrane protein
MTLDLSVWVSGQASEASRALHALKKENMPAARNAVVLIRDQDGQVFPFEIGDVDPRHGMLLGAIVGLLVEVLSGSISGDAASQTTIMDFSQEDLMALRMGFPLGGSALLLLLETEWLDETLKLLDRFQGRVWKRALSDHLQAKVAAEMVSQGR